MCPETFFDFSVPGHSFQVDLLYNLPSCFLDYSVHLCSFPVWKECSMHLCYTFLWRNLSSFCLPGMSLLKCLPKGPCLARHPTVVLWIQWDQSSEAAHGPLIHPVCIPQCVFMYKYWRWVPAMLLSQEKGEFLLPYLLDVSLFPLPYQGPWCGGTVVMKCNLKHCVL